MNKRKISLFLFALVLCTFMIPCLAGGAEQDAPVFSDVPANAWYAEAAAYCREHGVMNGVSDTAFAPDRSMTRAMLAAVLYRQAGSPGVSGDDTFSDTEDGAWYSDAVIWASQQELAQGYGNGVFGTNDPVTREQIAALFWRKAGSPKPAGTAEPFADQDSVSDYAADAVIWAKENGILHGRDNNRFAPKDNASRAEVAAILMHYIETVSQAPEPADPGTGDSGSNDSSGGGNSGGAAAPTPAPAPAPAESRILVAYFSATNTTKPLAEYASDILNADLYEIVPETPYTAEDLNYRNANSRTTKEQNDPDARPAIDGSVNNMDSYDVVFIGYPIWHGQAPRIISTFLESCDFSGKTIVPFCTSHSSGIGSSDTNLHRLASDANWLPGRRFPGGASRSTMESWIHGLELPEPEEENTVRAFDFENKTVTLNSGGVMPLNGLGTYSLHGETCKNAVKSAIEQGVRLIDTAHAYSNEEEIGQAIREEIAAGTVTREELFVITKIYPGSDMADPEAAIQGCLDRLNIGYVDMMLLHHPDANDVKAYQAMEKFAEAGKIRALGLSNWYVSELTSFLPQVSITPALVQNEIHPYYQENDVIPFIQEKGIVVQGWYPLGGRGHTAELLNDPAITAIAQANGVSSAQVILRWNLQKGVVVIPGSSNPDHIRENTELYHFELTENEMARINALDRGEKHDWY